jgi:hypothetical protein
MTETIVLKTRCGCSRRTQVTDIGDLYRVAMTPQLKPFGRPASDLPIPVNVDVRVFRYDGERSLTGQRVFREVRQ